MKIDTLQSVEVAEGVGILLRPAGPVPRAFAYFIDFLIRIALFLIIGLVVMLTTGAFGGIGMEIGSGVFLLFLFFLEWGYYVVCEAKWGASPGKRALGLKVVRTSGVPIGWGAAVLRNLLRSVDGQFWIGIGPVSVIPTGLLGLGSALMTRKFQRIGDLLADTVVVYADKQTESQAPELRPEARSILRIEPPPVALTREEQRAVVLYMERAGLWSDGRREELANHLHELTGQRNRAGVEKLLGMALWLRDS